MMSTNSLPDPGDKTAGFQTRHALRRLGAALALGPTLCGAACAGPLLDGAARLLAERMGAASASFYVYQDQDSALNHGYPSGFFGGGGVTPSSALKIDPGCIDDAAAASGCAPEGSPRLDRDRKTVLRLSFEPLRPGQFAGINFEEPEGYGNRPRGVGYDLRGATAVSFELRSASPVPWRVQFGVGGCTGEYLSVPSQWQTVTIPLNSLHPTATASDCAAALRDTHILFSVVSNDLNAPNGGVLLLDNVRFTPVPTAHANVLGFPLSTETFGVVPLVEAVPRQPVPPDRSLRNLSTTYESALVGVLSALGKTPDQGRHARQIGDAFLYALEHPNQGSKIPKDVGAVGLLNGYSAGPLALANAQPEARAGEVRLAGFSGGTSLCGGIL